MADLQTAIEGLAAVDVDGMPASALGEHIRALMHERDRLDGQIERALQVFDQRGYCETDGAPSTASWLRGRAHISGAEASLRVRTARALRRLPATARALAQGDLTLAHANAIAKLATETDAAATQRIEPQLIELAGMLEPVRFSCELRLIRDAFKRDGSDGEDTDSLADPDDAFRGFSMASSFEGRFNLNGWLAPEGGATLKAALDSLARPVPGDERTHAQRYADALVELARRQLNSGDLPAKNSVRPHLFVMSESQPVPATDQADDGGDPDAVRLRLIKGQVVGGGVLSDKSLERIACDATISRVLFGPDGHVLDLGRSSRLVSPGQWKALLLRDGGCVLPGHDCPAAFVEAHHLISWLSGGPTDLWNLASVCTFGHTLIHDRGYKLYLTRDNRWVLRKPDGTEIVGLRLGQTRRGHSGTIEVSMLNGPRGPCGD